MLIHLHNADECIICLECTLLFSYGRPQRLRQGYLLPLLRSWRRHCVQAPEVMDPKALGNVVGPAVHLYATDNGVWNGSVLVAAHKDAVREAPPTLSFKCGGAPAADVRAEVLYEHDFGGEHWVVMRFPLRVKMQKRSVQLQYNVKLADSKVPSGNIAIPGAEESWRIAGYSCNDQRQLPKVRSLRAWCCMAWPLLDVAHQCCKCTAVVVLTWLSSVCVDGRITAPSLWRPPDGCVFAAHQGAVRFGPLS